jgi:hypothetical protein
MYSLINENIGGILTAMERDHVKKYDWLIENIHKIESSSYQTSYKTFWRLHGAGLSSDYCSIYFQLLKKHLEEPIAIEKLVRYLFNKPVNSSGKKSLQFSFITKMLHMADRQLPIYDSLISSFYFFEPNRSLSFEERVDELIFFYEFLNFEYRRILKDSLLQESITAFRERFNSKHFTDEKIIDSLIWAFTSYGFNGAVINKSIVFR